MVLRCVLCNAWTSRILHCNSWDQLCVLDHKLETCPTASQLECWRGKQGCLCMGTLWPFALETDLQCARTAGVMAASAAWSVPQRKLPCWKDPWEKILEIVTSFMLPEQHGELMVTSCPFRNHILVQWAEVLGDGSKSLESCPCLLRCLWSVLATLPCGVLPEGRSCSWILEALRSIWRTLGLIFFFFL